jgi:hypothetical protein
MDEEIREEQLDAEQDDDVEGHVAKKRADDDGDDELGERNATKK